MKDLKGTCIYETCEKALLAGEPVPNLVVQVSKTDNDVLPSEPWGATLEETWVYIERVIAYWSRILKPAKSIPKQIISDRDTRWRGDFWKEICDKMGMKRALTTAYHPQADGQTEIMNQTQIGSVV